MRHLILLLLSIYFFLPKNASACDCGPSTTFKNDFEYADAIFIGKVVSKEAYHYGQRTTFEIEKSWKFTNRIPNSKIKIITGSLEDPCSYEFKINESYLVFAFANDSSSKNVSNRFVTNRCLNNKKRSEAATDIEALNAITVSAAISGSGPPFALEPDKQELDKSISWLSIAIINIAFIVICLICYGRIRKRKLLKARNFHVESNEKD